MSKNRVHVDLATDAYRTWARERLIQPSIRVNFNHRTLSTQLSELARAFEEIGIAIRQSPPRR